MSHGDGGERERRVNGADGFIVLMMLKDLQRGCQRNWES